MAAPTLHWDLFCRVIDNHGDLGVCWRLARALAARGQRVRMWVDDPSALAWMAPGIGLSPPANGLEGPARTPSEFTARQPAKADQGGDIAVHRWPAEAPPESEAPAPTPPWSSLTCGDVVVEAFGCDPPPAFVARMADSARAGRPPVWINLEYLSAEAYVARSHGLRSPQFSGPGAGLDKWFFYPGFTDDTGGLLLDDGAQPAPMTPAGPSGAPGGADASGTPVAGGTIDGPLQDGPRRRVLLFGYPADHWPASLSALRRWSTTQGPTTLLVPPGGLRDQVAQTLGAPLANRSPHGTGASARPADPAPRLAWQALAPVPQTAFDALLAGCDLVIVRGEDSFVRAQVASDTPFLWQIYPQDDGVHATKLDAFLDLYLADAPPALAHPLRRLFLAVNGLATWPTEPHPDTPDAPVPPPGTALPDQPTAATATGWPEPAAWRAHQRRWRARLRAAEDLPTRLMAFIAPRLPHPSVRCGTTE